MSQTQHRSTSPSFTAGLTLAAAALAFTSCAHPAAPINSPANPAAPTSSSVVSEALVPSSQLIVGRIFETDLPPGFAFVDLAAAAPVAALTEGTELVARTLDFRETARLRVSRYVRGRTLGTRILTGQPTPGDEVVWQAP
ncbi:MAG: hypothetical protein EXS38_10810 [Opitutus sp.]|nr:hypothetical protein [Opitutus sp.]